MKIAQLVDSSGNLPRNILNHYGIKEVPVYFSLDDQHYYRENQDFKTTDFYQHMKAHRDRVPKTAAVNVHDWMEGFSEMYEKGYQKMIVSTIASHLSCTMDNAKQAREIFLSTRHDVDIYICETNTCACGQAALEIYIAQMINDEGVSWEALLTRVNDIIPRVSSLFSVQEFTYMKAGGRIGGAVAFLGDLIKIMPVCEFIQGTVHPIKAIRGRKKSLTAMVEIALSRINNPENTIIVVQNALCEEDAKFMVDLLRTRLTFSGEIFQSLVGTTVGSHSGPGAIGIGFVEKS